MPNKQRRNRISQHITSTALRGPFQNEIFFCLKKLWETTNRIKLTNKPILFYYSFFTYLIHPPTQLVSLFLSPEYNVKKCIMSMQYVYIVAGLVWLVMWWWCWQLHRIFMLSRQSLRLTRWQFCRLHRHHRLSSNKQFLLGYWWCWYGGLQL